MREVARVLTVIISAGAVVALAAGCGGSSNNSADGYGGSSKSGTTNASARAATIAVANLSLGRILVNGQRRTVYSFEKDTGAKSTCYGRLRGGMAARDHEHASRGS